MIVAFFVKLFLFSSVSLSLSRALVFSLQLRCTCQHICSEHYWSDSHLMRDTLWLKTGGHWVEVLSSYSFVTVPLSSRLKKWRRSNLIYNDWRPIFDGEKHVNHDVTIYANLIITYSSRKRSMICKHLRYKINFLTGVYRSPKWWSYSCGSNMNISNYMIFVTRKSQNIRIESRLLTRRMLRKMELLTIISNMFMYRDWTSSYRYLHNHHLSHK